MNSIKMYTILEEVGEGSYGTVSKVVYEGNICALKQQEIFRHELGHHGTVYYKEASLLSLLGHANIIKPLKCFFQDNYFNMIMPYYDSEMDVDKCYDIFYALLSVCYYMEVNNILHRDIKQSNIIFKDDNIPILIDFGLATLIYDQKQYRDTGKYAQTYTYRAPEVYEGKRDYSSKIDVWSMGLIFFEFLSGMSLVSSSWTEDKVPEYLKKLTTTLDQKLEKAEITGDFAFLIRNMLKYDPAERFTFKQCLQSPPFGKIPKVPTLILPFPYPHLSPLELRIRHILTIWLLQVAYEFRTSYRLFITTIMVMDRFFQAKPEVASRKSKLQLYSIACMALSYTLFDYTNPPYEDFVYLTVNTYTVEELSEAMKEIFEALDFQLYCHLAQGLNAKPQDYIYLLVSGLITRVKRETTSDEITTLVMECPHEISCKNEEYEDMVGELIRRESFFA